MAKMQNPPPRPDVTKARWAFHSLVLCITIGPQGVQAIEPVRTEWVGQLHLWPDLEEPLPDLERVETFGQPLAQELQNAFAGQPFAPTVSWDIQGPVWYREFYEQICRLPSGRISPLPETMKVGAETVGPKQVLAALRQCRLAPLVPLHRVGLPDGKWLPYPLGKYWKEFLLRQELDSKRSVAISVESPTLVPSIVHPSEIPASRAAKAAEPDGGSVQDRSAEMTLSDYFQRYLKTRGQSCRAQTRQIYEMTFRQALSFWGADVLLRQITPPMAYEFISTRTRIASHGQGYSPASRNRHLRGCKAAFRMAMQWGYIQTDPFAHIRPERVPPRRWHFLKPSEFQAILTVVPDPRWQAFYLLAYTTGARFGELFNLTWSDVDFDQATISIHHRPAALELPPFSVKDHEDRVLPLLPSTIDTLRAWQKAASAEVPFILLTAERWKRIQEHWKLCHAGKPWKYHGQTRQWRWAEWEGRGMVNNVLRDVRIHARKAGVKPTAPLTIHTLRKSFAQNHANSGTPSITLKRLMGHASITTTERYYLQKSDDNIMAAVRRYEFLLQASSR